MDKKIGDGQENGKKSVFWGGKNSDFGVFIGDCEGE